MGSTSWLLGLLLALIFVSSLTYYEVLDARNDELKSKVQQAQKQVEDIKRSRGYD